MSDRRSFLKDVSCSMIGLPLIPHLAGMDKIDWTQWADIKDQYPMNKEGLLNFNCGSAGVQPTFVLESFKAHQRALSAFAPYEVYEQHKSQVLISRQRLADLINADPAELALVRNTTEGINAVLFGIQWKSGDEILISEVDYPLVWNTAKVLEARYQVVIKTISVNTAVDSDAQIIQKYKKMLSSRTRLLITTHVTHREGHVMPVSELSALGKQHGVEVLVDGAHGVGHIQVDLKEIGCQYYATSLHKWLSAPLGTGLLYVQKDKIAALIPPTSFGEGQVDSIDKFMSIGTFAFEKWMALESVLDFQDKIGLDSKSARLRAMSTKFRTDLGKISQLTLASNQENCGGVTAFRCDNTNNSKLHGRLHNEYGCHLKKVGVGKSQRLFLRASFNLHLDDRDIDYLVESIKAIIS